MQRPPAYEGEVYEVYVCYRPRIFDLAELAGRDLITLILDEARRVYLHLSLL